MRSLSLVLLFLAICSVAVSGTSREGGLTVYTVNYPLQYFAQRIAGEHAEVVFPVPPGVDPAFWTPDARTIAAFQRADLILLNGAGYAKWLNRASLHRWRQVNTSAAFRDKYIVSAGGVSHSHGPGGEHAHAGTAFTTWLDLSQAAAQAKAVMQALGRMRPQHASAFERGYRELEKELMELDAEIRAVVAADPDRFLVASHPVYQYLARRYSLNLKSVLWEPEIPPAEQQWVELMQLLEKHPAAAMIWEAEPDPLAAKRLGSIGIASLVFDPCANVPDDGDLLSVIRRNIANLAGVYGSASRDSTYSAPPQ